MTSFLKMLQRILERLAVWCLLAVLISSFASAQSGTDGMAATAIVEPDLAIARLPVEMINNRIHVTLEVAGQPVKMLLDTGASATILFGDHFRGLDQQEQIEIAFPAFKASATGYRLNNVQFRTNTFSYTSERVILIENRQQVSSALSDTVEGILGRNFFDRYIIEIIPSESLMVLFPPQTKIGHRFRYRYQLFMDGGSPYLVHRSRMPWEDRRTPKKLLLDTGYPGGIVLWDEKHFNLATDTQERKALLAENKGIVYFGIVRFGKLIFKNIPIFIGPEAPSRTDDRHGIMGASMFLPFRYAFDFDRNSLWLSPRANSIGLGYQISNEVIFTPGNEEFVVKKFERRPNMAPVITLHKDEAVIPE